MIVRAKEKSLALILRYDGALPENIVSDRVRLRQILINLVSNAIKFTEHGTVQIVARFIAKTSSLEFEVIDTGIGIAKEMQQHLFEPFAQADTSATREYGGTGLGLAITKRLVDMMGGTIAFATQIKRGTAFRVAIPTHALDATTIRLPGALNPAQSWIANSPLDCRVLVVDDRREIRYLVRQFIEEAGGRAYTVGDGHSSFEAVQSADQENQPFDIVLMDMQMPGLGRDIIVNIADTGSGIPEGIDIFQPFMTTKTHGTGVGMAVVCELLSAHGATIAYTSKQGEGTIFEIKLPLSPPSPETEVSSPLPSI